MSSAITSVYRPDLNVSPPITKEQSFIERLRAFLSDYHTLRNMRKICLGVETISNDVRYILLGRAQEFLPEELLLKGYKSPKNDTQDFGDELLLQAEILSQSGDHEKAEKFETLAIRWFLVPHLLKGWDSTYEEIKQNCLSTLEEIEKKKISFKENYLGFKTLLQNVVPKKTSTERLRRCVEYYFSEIQNTLQKKRSEDPLEFHICLSHALDNGLSLNPRRAHLWTRKTYDGTQFIYVPDPVHQYPREDLLNETVATEVFVSKSNSVANHFFTARRSRVFLYQEETIPDLQKERSIHESILSLPGAKRFFAPLPITYHTYVAKAPGLENFQEDLRFTHSLTTLQFLDVFQGVIGGLKLLETHNYVSCDIKNENIVFRREADTVYGMIDHCMNVYVVGFQILPNESKRLNALAKNGCLSFETHRYAIVIAIAEAFFLDLEQHLPSDKWGCESHALNRIKNIVYDPHYEKIKELKRNHRGFGVRFSQDLLEYITKIAREGEEGLQLLILEQFAFKMALFPQVSALFLRTKQADDSHKHLLNIPCLYDQISSSEPRIPSLDQIQEVLQEGKGNLQDLYFTREHTNIKQISLDQVSEIVTTLLDEEITKSDLRIQILKEIINDVLKESSFIGSEVRIRKYTPWKDTDLRAPFSLWIVVQQDNLRLEFFDPIQKDVFEVGGNKKVKAGMQVDISVEGVIQYTPIVISRIRGGALDWRRRLAKGDRMQEKILKIPGAEKYFLALSRKHAPHFSSHKRKLELISLKFEDTLIGAIKKKAVNTKDGFLYLSKGHYIGFLQNIGEGIKLLRDRKISHGDMKIGNIAIASRQGELGAFIFDHDFSGSFYEVYSPNSYLYWNTLRQNWGFVSAETDLYGYVLIIAEVLLQNFETYNQSEGKESRMLRFQRIAKESSQEKQSMQEELERRIIDLCPAISEDLDAFFSIPLHSRRVDDIPASFFKFIQSLEVEDFLALFKHVDLENFIVELLILHPVFDLLANTFRADQESIIKMQENLLKIGNEKEAALKALKDAKFPTPKEIEEMLAICEEISKAVGDRLH